MSTIEEILDIAVQSGELIQELENGPTAVVYALADMADSYIAIQLPAYAALKDACGSVPTCITALKDTRNALFLQLAKITGIWQLIKGIIRVFKMIPKELRLIAGKLSAKALEAIGFVKNAFSALTSMNPEQLWALAKSGVGLIANSPQMIFDIAGSLAEQVKSLYAPYLAAVLGAIETVPVLGTIVSGAVTVYHAITAAASDVNTAIEEDPVLLLIPGVPIVAGVTEVVDFFDSLI